MVYINACKFSMNISKKQLHFNLILSTNLLTNEFNAHLYYDIIYLPFVPSGGFITFYHLPPSCFSSVALGATDFISNFLFSLWKIPV